MSSPSTATVSAPASASPSRLAASSTGAEAVFREASASLAFLETPIGGGSGFVLDSRHVATCAHVLGPYSFARVAFPGATSMAGKLVARDRMGDLAVLEVSVPPGFTPARAGPVAAVAAGARVYLVGFPLADRREPRASIEEGLLGGGMFEWGDTGMSYMQTDAIIEHGQSGGLLLAVDGSAIGVTCASRGRFAVALAIDDALARIKRLVAGTLADSLTERQLPQAGPNDPHTGSAELRHRADVATWVIDANQGDKPATFSMRSTVPVILVATAAGGGLVQTSGRTPLKRATIRPEFDPPGPYMLAVEPEGGAGQVRVSGSVPIKRFRDPDDGRLATVAGTLMGAVDYGGDLDWMTIQLTAGQSITVTASAVAFDPVLFVDQAGRRERPLAAGQDGGGPIGWDDEIEFRAPTTGEFLLIVSDARRIGSGAYRVSIESRG